MASDAVGTACLKNRWWVQKRAAWVPLACEVGRGRYWPGACRVSVTSGASQHLDPASLCTHVGDVFSDSISGYQNVVGGLWARHVLST
jgi:hypothetical protein